jgi:tetratricopeptide (TPR) repeat protein
MIALSNRVIRLAGVCAGVAAMSLAILTFAAPTRAALEGAQAKDKPAQVSDGETKAIAKINAAPDAAAKIQAAAEFVKKYPKSTMRARVVAQLAGEINKVQDPAQRISSFESLQAVFKEPSDAEVISPLLIDAYVAANRLDDAFRLGADTMAKNPNDITTMTNLGIIGVNEVKKNNSKYAQQSQSYGAKAIEFIEAGKKPDSFDDARWTEYQSKWLPQLYQGMGLLAIVSGNKPEARAKLAKAASLNPSDPFNYYLMGHMLNDEYKEKAEEFQKQSAGPLKDVKLKEAEGTMDQVIEAWARVVALSEGNPQYQQLHDAVLQDLQSYFKYRHNGSSDGLQLLIDKYKKNSGQ